ncbi:AAA family ATPase [Pseudogulbenkiania subflava]|uniref:Predicted ATP-dependent endonuclease of the OLD family, contains P-loop ATPase and TOPRIM domains n=1 Tax=Pseudogulbenkiania subflava DSM 22618 TaxID=1123014 RepID=A0A1Y6BJ20_9NEIS|nr:AAA family ATPase [Pseudogulbenkiania subflava]SMF14001.1 Predicted ATP-dependent endonuclease of the OLD family, contains P-loop ATPase and TOPRIM domains [Pseudogulbenkiania subflava DSM 22618]
MRLKHLHISQYKNLRDFSLNFDGSSFIDIFVGKNGSGKSNLFEALIEIFRHLDQLGRADNDIGFDYTLRYEINEQETEIEWKTSKLRINQDNDRKSLGQTPFPDNVLIYYSGHNTTVSSLVADYEKNFRGRIKGANLEDSRRFICIGPGYKALLLAVLLVQPEGGRAHTFIRQKLGIDKLGITKPGTDEVAEPVLRVELQRPEYARGKKDFDIELNDESDRYWKADGITKDFLDTLSHCIWSNVDALTVTEGYLSGDDRYVLYLTISKLQESFSGKWQELFRQFDNLKTLGMLDGISVPLRLTSGLEGNINHFSDGQFQSVYIYSIVELFKDRNCLTLLDEPDAFLHPEWQFDFLKQVFEITDTEARQNHVLMSSHSAVTLIPHEKQKIKFFDIKENKANCYDLPKTIAIKKLSSDLIKFSEQEQLLSIINAVQIEKKPVLFTEGSTDPIILKEAWYKLFEEDMPFIPFYAFSCTYINQLLTDNRIHGEMGGLPVFALFDFDKAYDQWNGLNGDVLATDPMRGLIKKWKNGESYALMLPVPQHADILRQVIKNSETKETFGGDSSCEIEHLFYGQAATAEYYHQEPCPGGSKVTFKSDKDKTHFAKTVVPQLPAECFEPFKPIFEFIAAKCRAQEEAQTQPT